MVNAPSWTDDELRDVMRLETAEFVARHPHRTDAAARSQRNRMIREGMTAPPHDQAAANRAAREMLRQADRNLAPLATQTVVPEPDDAQYEELFRLLEDVDTSIAALSPTQDSTEFHAPDDGLPVGIAFTSDWHLGAGGVDGARLRADLQLIQETDGLYVVGGGDYLEGVGIYTKAASALYGGLFNDGDLQEMATLLRMKLAAGKWIALVEGNHDAWLKRASGLSRVKRLAAQLGAQGQRPPHFCQGGGTIFAHVGAYKYVIAVTHNAKGNSQLNTTNAQRRTFDAWPTWENCHVICCGHLHYPDLQVVPRKGGRCVYLRSGTYKLRDSYAADHGFKPGYGVPIAILLPDKEFVIPWPGDDFGRGVAYLTSLRRDYTTRTQAT